MNSLDVSSGIKMIAAMTSAVILVVFAYCGAKRAQAATVIADLCVIIAQEQSRQFTDALDKFGQSKQLVVDKSSPVSWVYTDQAKQQMLVYRKNFGEIGSIFSHYDLTASAAGAQFINDIHEYFDRLYGNHNFFSRKCEVENLQLPTIVYQ